MLRTALKPRWLALLLVVLAASAGMARLGEWQLDRARDSGKRAEAERLSATPVDVSSVVRARQTFPADGVDRPVTVSGRFDLAAQVLLPGRELDGRRGLWVLTPLVLDDGSAVPVLRGWVASADDAAVTAPPEGADAVRVVGVLRPAEAPLKTEPGTDLGLPAGQVPRIDTTELIKRWSYPLIDAYVQLRSQAPAPALAPAPVPVVAEGSGVAWRNLSYALQWWIFAGFGLFLWWRLVRDDHAGRLDPVPATVTEPGPSEPGPSEPRLSEPDPSEPRPSDPSPSSPGATP